MVEHRCSKLLLREDREFIMGCANTEQRKSSTIP